MMHYYTFYTLYGFTDNRQRSKILTDNRQSNEILTDNRHVDPPRPFSDPLSNVMFLSETFETC